MLRFLADSRLARNPNLYFEIGSRASIYSFSISAGLGGKWLEVVSKPLQTSNSCVAVFFKMLTYHLICSAFSSARALLLNAIIGFDTTSNDF